MFKKYKSIVVCVCISSSLIISCAENTIPERQYEVEKTIEREAPSNPNIGIISANHTDDIVDLQIKLSSGSVLDGVKYKEGNEAKNSKSAIYIKDYAPLKMSDHDFLELLETLLEYERESLSTRVTSINFDIDAVESIWESVVSAVSTEQQSNHSRVRQEREQLYHILSPAVNNVKVIAEICDLLQKYEYECFSQPAGTSHLFKVEHRGQRWSDLSKLPDVGLDRTSSVNILVK